MCKQVGLTTVTSVETEGGFLHPGSSSVGAVRSDAVTAAASPGKVHRGLPVDAHHAASAWMVIQTVMTALVLTKVSRSVGSTGSYFRKLLCIYLKKV